MHIGKLLQSLTGIVIAALVSGLASCVPYHGAPRVYAPTHRNYPYHHYYYPSIGVYFHLHSGHYYYHSDRRWIRSPHLPPRLYLDRKDRVRLWIDADTPYLRNDIHRRKYKPYGSYRTDKHRNRREREHNLNKHREYQNRYRHKYRG